MANGFITLENGEVFFTRWTGYDMILEIVARELEIMGDKEFADWVKTQFPNEKEEKGDAVFWNSQNEMIQRSLDLRGLPKMNREKFWQALSLGAKNLDQFGMEYSKLNPDRLTELITMHSKAINHIDLEKILKEYVEDIVSVVKIMEADGLSKNPEQSWQETLYKAGEIKEHDLKYDFHGIGCWVKWKDRIIDFDFRGNTENAIFGIDPGLLHITLRV